MLSFVFEKENGPERFHFRLLLTVPGPGYYLFDCFDKTANVIVPNDDDNAVWIQQLAEQVGGHKTTPNLRQEEKPHPVSRARRSKYRVGDTWVKRHGKDREFPG